MVEMSKIILGICIICYLIGIIFVMKYEPFGNNPTASALSISMSVFGFFIIVFLGLLISQFNVPVPVSSTRNDGSARSFPLQIFMNFGLIFSIIFIVFLISVLGIQYFDPSPSTTGGTALVLNIFLMFGVLAFFIKLVRGKKKLHDNNTIWSLIKNVILFIPCLMIDVIEFLKYQYNITTSTHWIILAIDIGILLAKDKLPKIKSFLFDVGGKQLLKEPVYLNELKHIASYNDLVPQPKIDDDHKPHSKEPKFNYNYALSMWIYINPQPPSTSSAYTRFTQLFNFGNKPLISYNSMLNTFKITMQQGKEKQEVIYESKDMPLQKWNNFVINYNGGTLDIFINGELVVSKPGVVPYMRFDKLEVGELDGIHGGICNVKYYNDALSKGMIKSIFNTVRYKNPPVM